MTDIKKNRKTTIYDLAQLTGISASAVSAILNGSWKKRRISPGRAEQVMRIAEQQGYTVNRQASLLRSRKSGVIGMIVPKYDNRYFGAIVEKFEAMARARGLFPFVTCTSRDPDLELEAARNMLSWQVDWVIATGATQPDKITQLCVQAGVRSLNLDLPGTLAPSVISDNYAGAKALTSRILDNVMRHKGSALPLVFIGGRGSDYNTRERLRGFLDAHSDYRVAVPDACLLPCGYASEKAETALADFCSGPENQLNGLFVNSTISLEGVLRELSRNRTTAQPLPPLGCFDWDPFVTLLNRNIDMVKQDVPKMLEAAFTLIDMDNTTPEIVQIPPLHVKA
ncbi:LacI family DNA-binding transcriptional regulator [Jejubacter calystegiae]|uniref:LacI family DNA-binding transcriptional regulator n=1 Tax=Jejubacter calystegiae TaxID=2579935 RepID=A0A4P8YDZ6_9ENTR|nr:LacI family DNA-binding transcriptional regulator [Jejubacter calystegiae]QCT18825.1 LacI family DNA-binding transcriptional regulator [Jejubacter calystegiae]